MELEFSVWINYGFPRVPLPVEWAGFSMGERKAGSLVAFERRSRAVSLDNYAAFECQVTGCNDVVMWCGVCWGMCV